MARAPVPVLSPPGRAALRAFVDRATLLAFDLDGTLAPIVADPAAAGVSADVRARLVRLDRQAPVVVITGRSRADARRRLGFRPRHLVGNHGAEGLPGRAAAERAFRRLAAAWTTQLRPLLPEAPAEGILIEEKGATLSLHYRNAADRARARRLILRAARALTPAPRRVHGKFVENLLPPGAPDKGDALDALVRALGCRRALFVGDDETDEAVFRRRAPAVFGVRVGATAATAARGALRAQAEIVPLLDELLGALAALPRSARRDFCGPRHERRDRGGLAPRPRQRTAL